MSRNTGEMPFLEHLEELRIRILKSLGALVVAVGAGIWLVERFQLVVILKSPISPFLPQGRLVIQSPTEPIMIVLKLGLIVGLVLASPVILWQTWAFLSPALYEREKKAIVPALFAGLLLFLTGAVLSFMLVVPRALRVLLSFQTESFQTLITFEKYFDFVMQVVLAMGLSAELPLVLILLAALGVVTPAMLSRFRRFAILLSFIAGAVLSPGTDVFSMLLMTAPLLILYEVGVAGAYLIHRRRLRRAAATAALILLGLAAGAGSVAAQRPTPRPPRPQPGARDTTRAGRGGVGDTTQVQLARPMDSATAGRLGLPQRPKRGFPPADSVISELLDLQDYQVTRYQADTAAVHRPDRRVELKGQAMTERSGSTLEADTIVYREGDCKLVARGQPHLFQGGTVVVGKDVRYDTCQQRGVVQQGMTSFPQQGANWLIRGNLALDSASNRLYGTAREITSCDLPLAHYHFAARELKWVSKSVMVARPAVLYIRDVPVAWIPFLFQDTKQGRRSGILIPEFGFNDIVRPSRGYNRTVRNIGYYWAPNDYFDALVRFDWFSNRYVEYSVEGQYRWLDRFVNGRVAYTQQRDVSGTSSMAVFWNHQQTFSATTRMNVSLNYVTNSSIVSRNAIDPRLNTQSITSSANFTKQFVWGNLALGGTRRQSITDNSGSQTFPTLSLSPKPIDVGSAITWSPDLNFTNETLFNQALPVLLLPRVGGGVDTVKLTAGSRASRFSLNTPLRIGGFNWQNSLAFVDTDSTGRRQETVRRPNLDTPDPNDSVTVVQVRNGGFGGSLDWDTRFNLPIFFRTTWKLTPSLGIANTTSGAFLIRNQQTGGNWVAQGKRFNLGLSLSPTLFGFLPGFGPISKIRHTLQPALSYSFSPAANVPEAYAKAITRPGQAVIRRSDPTQTATISLNQNFEGKGRPSANDTAGTSARKFRLLSLTTSGISYDFEQAKKPGRTGWTSQTLSNSFQSDLVPGFNFAIAHDLWNGPVGYDSTRFDPFLSSLTASFALTGGTFRSLASLLGLAAKPEEGRRQPPQGPQQFGGPTSFNDLRRSGSFGANAFAGRGSKSFQANVDFTLGRTRPSKDSTIPTPKTQSNIRFNTSFSPTRFWSVSWSTQFDAAKSQFESQQVLLSRDLHDWRAMFSFLRNANGNFSFAFSITLTDLPDIKFDYRQSTIQP